jgi:hypothetical protein
MPPVAEGLGTRPPVALVVVRPAERVLHLVAVAVREAHRLVAVRGAVELALGRTGLLVPVARVRCTQVVLRPIVVVVVVASTAAAAAAPPVPVGLGMVVVVVVDRH